MTKTPTTKTAPREKWGRLPGAKDIQPRQRKIATTTPVTTYNIVEPQLTNTQSLENKEISIQYQHTGQIYKRPETTLNKQFAYHIAQDITNETPNPLTIKEAQKRPDWPQWQEAIHTEMDALIKRHVFGPFKLASPGNNYTDS